MKNLVELFDIFIDDYVYRTSDENYFDDVGYHRSGEFALRKNGLDREILLLNSKKFEVIFEFNEIDCLNEREAMYLNDRYYRIVDNTIDSNLISKFEKVLKEHGFEKD